MSAASPRGRVGLILLAAMAALLPALAAPTASADPVAGPTSITVGAEVAPDFTVSAQGALTDSAGSPIPAVEVEGYVNGEPLTVATTGGDGTYTMEFVLPEDSRTGEQQLVAFFAGQGDMDASQSAITISAPGTAPPPPDPPTEPPQDTRLDVFIDVSVAPTTVSAGGLVTVEGTITDSNRVPVAGAMISLLLDDEESTDSRVVSSDVGTFQTFAEISRGAPAGESTLVVSFAGNDGYTPGLRRFTLNVDAALVVDETSPPASPSEPVETEASASATATTDAPAEDDPDAASDRSPLSWFYAALILVGGTAVLVAAILVFRGKYVRRSDASHGDEGGLDLLLDDPAASTPHETPPAHAPSDEAEAPHEADNSTGTQDFPTPRRSLD